MEEGHTLSFWSLLGLVSKKDFDIVSQKLANMTNLMESLVQQNNIMNQSIQVLGNQINKGFESSITVNKDAVDFICDSNNRNLSTMTDVMQNLSGNLSSDLNSINTELDSKLRLVNESLKILIGNTDSHTQKNTEYNELLNRKLENVLKSISENAEMLKSKTCEDIEEKTFVISNAISAVIKILNEQSANNSENLKNIEMLFSKLFEIVKIIWVDKMVDDLEKNTSNLNDVHGR